MKRYACVYCRKGDLFFRSLSQTTVGVLIGSDLISVLNETNSSADKGNAALKALCGFVQGIPHPTSWRSDDDDPLHAAAGVRTWATFVRGAAFVGIELENDTLTFNPSLNKGAKDGFKPLSGKSVQLRGDASAEEIGMALDRAFSLCEPKRLN